MRNQNELYYTSESRRLLKIMDWLSGTQFTEITDNGENIKLIQHLLDEDKPTSSQISLYLRLNVLLIEKRREERINTYLEGKTELIEAICGNIPSEISTYLHDLILRTEKRDIDFLSAISNNLLIQKNE